MTRRGSALRIAAALLSRTLLLLVIASAVTGAASAAERLARPDWSAIFSPDGKVIDLRGGVDAFFLEDKISDGVGIDMTVIAPADKPTVDNGLVSASNDLGNGYVYARKDAAGNLQLYAGVERLASTADGYVEFEFNQGLVQVLSGVPWIVHGDRTAGDILVRVDFVTGVPNSATFMRWNGSAFEAIANVQADGFECAGADFLLCGGTPPLESVQAEAWDAAYNIVQVPPPDTFLEVGLNVGVTEFSSIQVKTAEDVILDSFQGIGLWAHRSQVGGQQ